MTGQQNTEKPLMFEQAPQAVPFLPDLCSTNAVLILVLVSELLALVLVLGKYGVMNFSWDALGGISFLVQWIVLSSAAVLCSAKKKLNAYSSAALVGVAYVVVLVITAAFSILGQWFFRDTHSIQWGIVVNNLAIAAIFAGILLRFLYLQHQLNIREQSELNARVQALQSRMRPHFLFNSLNSIVSLIVLKPDVAEKTVMDLAKLFRASLQSPQEISIEEELKYCQSFIDIEQLRLGSRLEFEKKIDLLPSNARILNLLLQPLLENAIYHGIEPLPNGGKVSLEIKAVDSDIVIKVSNPALHAGPPQFRAEGETRELSGNGIALANIRRRLAALYGGRAYLRIVKGEADYSAVLRYPLS